MTLSTLAAVLVVGAATGFLGGLFGKGGSAVATPVLAALGVPAIVAVASPLPATIPGTLLAARQYRRRGLVDGRTLRWTVAVGLPATLLGALATRWVDGEDLVVGTDLLVLALGLAVVVGAARRWGHGRALGAGPEAAPPAEVVRPRPVELVVVAAVVGVAAGLLANSGGFLLAPLFLLVLHLPVRPALGTSLAVSAALAVPGTLAHAALGHVDWTLVAVFAAASVPLSAVGARVALRVDPQRLEAVFGTVLVALAAVLLARR